MATSSFLSAKPSPSSSSSSSSSSSFWNSPSRGSLPCSSLRLRLRRCSKPLGSFALVLRAASSRPEDPDQQLQSRQEEEERLISSLSVEEIEQKLGKRRRGKRASSSSSSSSSSSAAAPQSKPRKDWEEMSLSEKALELYVGEKGALYWLNKFAYASIFIIIGGWIAFRFIGPALNLYQLESPLLPPDQVLRGSASP